MKLCLIRHGQTKVGSDGLYRPDSGLTELGHQQASEVAAAIADMPIEICYTSVLPRAIETATHYVNERDIELVRIEALNEIFTGDIYSAPESIRLRIIGHDFDLDFGQFGGESKTSFSERIAGGWNQLKADCERRGVAFAAAFLHGGSIAAIIDIINGDDFNYRRRPRMPNCAYTVIDLPTDGEGWQWERWESDHLTQSTRS